MFDENRGLDVLAVILVWLFVPGTRKVVTLAEFNYIFGVPTRLHIEYQIFTVLPWLLHSCIPWIIKDYIPWILRWYFCCGAGGEEQLNVRKRLPHLPELYVWKTIRTINRGGNGQDINDDSDAIMDDHQLNNGLSSQRCYVLANECWLAIIFSKRLRCGSEDKSHTLYLSFHGMATSFIINYLPRQVVGDQSIWKIGIYLVAGCWHYMASCKFWQQHVLKIQY